VKPADVARLLSKCAAYDRRTIGAAEVAAWHEALADLDIDLAAALAAVAAHYRDSRQFAMPSDIRDRVLARRSEPPYRQPLAAAPHAPEFDAERAHAWLAQCREVLRDVPHEPAPHYVPRRDRGPTPTRSAPADCWTSDPVVECTWREVLRDAWAHNYTVVVDGVPVWRGGRWGVFEALMYDLRGWRKLTPARAEELRGHVLASVIAATIYVRAAVAVPDERPF
jgi:hypothetical protein